MALVKPLFSRNLPVRPSAAFELPSLLWQAGALTFAAFGRGFILLV